MLVSAYTRGLLHVLYDTASASLTILLMNMQYSTYAQRVLLSKRY